MSRLGEECSLECTPVPKVLEVRFWTTFCEFGHAKGRSLCGTHYALNFQCSVFRFRFFEGKEVGTALSTASD